MDTEIWSQTDIRNGRILMTLLFLAILGREFYTLAAMLVGGLPYVLPEPADLPYIGTDLFFQILIGTGIQILLLILVNRGHRVARWGLGLFLVISAAAFLSAVYGQVFDMPTEQQTYVAVVSGVGLIGGLLLLFSPPLQAFVWFQSVQRQTLPVPLDEDGEFIGRRRRRVGTVHLFSGIVGAIGTALVVISALAVSAYLYGLPELLGNYF